MDETGNGRNGPRRWRYALAAVVFAALGAYARVSPSAPGQPIAFAHSVHLKAGVTCTACHQDASTSPRAGLPSARECALCHAKIGTQSPVVRQALGYARRGEEIPWRPVYSFASSAHVLFRHDMHVRNGIACSTCHGDLRQAATARVWRPFNMGVCLSCHKEHGAGTECEQCHY